MPDMTVPLKLGVNIWNQYTDWESFLTAHRRADELGFDSLWTWDHLYPIVGSYEGPIFEAYTAMSAVAALTERATIGLMVGANTFRDPALVAKMITTIDHISRGRAVLGIGAAWFETEHRAFGLPYGESPGERLRWLREALPIMRGMLDGTRPTVHGARYTTNAVLNLPPPVQEHLPIMIGGSGPRVTLRLVAEYADACNIGGPVRDLPRKEANLVAHCQAVGRDESTVERTGIAGKPLIRATREEAFEVMARIYGEQGDAVSWQGRPVGAADDVIAHCTRFLELGYRHIIFDLPAPFDLESLERLARDVRPALEAYRP
jgi:alkanesulfonate monooxygenase SsuD/methylene tetrahydromethanopterin reductase-like flavin-dependent oxidoreductase (luciferase family)